VGRAALELCGQDPFLTVDESGHQRGGRKPGVQPLTFVTRTH
jgi:hypothetical protein